MSAPALKQLVITSLFFLSLPTFSAQTTGTEDFSISKKSELSESELTQAKQWKLTLKEFKKFKEIKNSPRAYFTPNLENNPLLGLALESETETERASYADRWVQIQFENNVKVISWQLEVSEAWKRQYPGVPRFVYNNPSMEKHTVKSMNAGSVSTFNKIMNDSNRFDIVTAKPRAQLYISVVGCESCVAAYKAQYDALKSGAIDGIDIHFINGPNKTDIINWAVENKLSSADVNEARVVTLNVADKKVDKVPLVELIN